MVKSWLKMTNSLDDLDAVRDNFLQFQRSLDRGQTWSVPKVVVPSLLWPNITLQPRPVSTVQHKFLLPLIKHSLLSLTPSLHPSRDKSCHRAVLHINNMRYIPATKYRVLREISPAWLETWPPQRGEREAGPRHANSDVRIKIDSTNELHPGPLGC